MKISVFKEQKCVIDNVDELYLADKIVNFVDKEFFDEFLDEIYEPFQINDMVYAPSYCLQILDYIYYEQMFYDYVDSIAESVITSNESEVCLNGLTFIKVQE